METGEKAAGQIRTEDEQEEEEEQEEKEEEEEQDSNTCQVQWTSSPHCSHHKSVPRFRQKPK